MANWYPSTIEFSGTPDQFLAAIGAWKAHAEFLRITHLEFEVDEDGSSCANFLTAWAPTCCFARFLSLSLREGPVYLDFDNVWDERHISTICATGHLAWFERRDGHEILRWSRASGKFEVFMVDYEEGEDPDAWQGGVEVLINRERVRDFCLGCKGNRDACWRDW